MAPESGPEAPVDPARLGGRGKAAVVVFLIAGAAAGGYARFGGEAPVAATPAQCREALLAAAMLAPYARGTMALFRPAEASDNLAHLAFVDAAGTPVALSAFRGKTVLLNFWATWCVPCRAEMPALDQLQADLGGDSFEVIAVNLDVDSTPGRERAFLDEVGATHLAFYADPSLALTQQLHRRGLVFGLPTTLLVDRTGCRLGTTEGGATWNSADAKALIDAAIAAPAAPA